MSNIKDSTSNWGKEEFLAFLMLQIGNADLKLSREELMIIDKIVTEEQFEQVNWVFSKCNDFECINLIKVMQKQFFPGDDGKEKLIEEMKLIALSDNDLSINEEIMIRSLKKLL